MTTHIIVSVAMVTTLLFGVDGGYLGINEGPSFSPAITDFSLSLFNILNENKTDENLLISSTSIFRAMLVTYFGSEGLTRLLMEVAMKLDMNYTEAVNQYELWRNQTLDGVKEGDRIYVDSKIQLKPNITALLGKDISQIDFFDNSSVEVINDWVSKTTGGEIKNFISKIDGNTSMMLISVISMKQSWKSPFDKRKTKFGFFFQEDGLTKYTQMMNKKGKFYYMDASSLNSEILSIPYDNDRYQFVILFPYYDMTVGNLISSLNYTILVEQLRNMSLEEIMLSLPKFTDEAEVDMKPLLESLGLFNLFSPRTANLSGFTDDELYISDVLQKAVIKVDEKGTTAAAVTALRLGVRSLRIREIKKIDVNRPFVYMVYDRVAQVPLFLGKVMSPECPAEVEVVHKFGPSITDFSLDLFRVLQENSTGDNLVMSPSNIFRVMLLTYFGSAGNTSRVMRNVMRIDMNFSETFSQYTIWKNAIFGGVKEADRIYIDTSFSLRDRIKTLLAEDISQLNFSDTESVNVINDWVEEKTEGEISNFLDELEPDAQMLLTSVIYMKEKWLNRFEPEDTRAMNFTLRNGTTKEVQMMVKQNALYKYIHSGTLRSRIVTIPYEDETLSFVVFLPDESNSTTVEDVLTCMNSTNIKKEFKSRYLERIDLYLPKFNIKKKVDFSPVLYQIGMSEIFYAGIANFDNFTIDPTLHVSKVFQQVVIRVDEEGTTASAASGVILVSYGGYQRQTENFLIDKPFLYMVYDEKAEVPLFLGTIMDPTVIE